MGYIPHAAIKSMVLVDFIAKFTLGNENSHKKAEGYK